jgi:hypothetical protein
MSTALEWDANWIHETYLQRAHAAARGGEEGGNAQELRANAAAQRSYRCAWMSGGSVK